MTQRIQNWQSAEQLVSFLEKVISPDSKVEHNVFLPVRGQNRKRQCDVVVRMGKPPREHLIIVEVQKRGRKPELTTFHGWVKKMEEVGANALICVSAKGFPQSIIEDVAMNHGDRVKLMTLSPIDHPGKAWASFHLNMTITEIRLRREIGMTSSIELFDPMPKELRIDVRSPILSMTGRAEDAEYLVSFSKHYLKDKDIADLFIADRSRKAVKAQITLRDIGNPVWIHVDGNVSRVKAWDIEVIVHQEEVNKDHELSKWSYSQQDHAGVLVWVASAQTVASSGKILTVEIAFLPIGDGKFSTQVNCRGDVKWDCRLSASSPFIIDVQSRVGTS